MEVRPLHKMGSGSRVEENRGKLGRYWRLNKHLRGQRGSRNKAEEGLVLLHLQRKVYCSSCRRACRSLLSLSLSNSAHQKSPKAFFIEARASPTFYDCFYVSGSRIWTKIISRFSSEDFFEDQQTWTLDPTEEKVLEVVHLTAFIIFRSLSTACCEVNFLLLE